MKKLNRKGFTLVELLAVIIILAIVVGISIPAVLTTVNNTKIKAAKTAASSVADWVDRQYQTAKTGLDTGTGGVATLDPAFKSLCGDDGSTCEASSGVAASTMTGGANAFISAAGVKPSNVSYILVKINSTTGRSCVTLTLNSTGDYKAENNATTVNGGVC